MLIEENNSWSKKSREDLIKELQVKKKDFELTQDVFLDCIEEYDLSEDEIFEVLLKKGGQSPLIFVQADDEIADEAYSINLLWIHKNKLDNLDQKNHIFLEDNDKFKEKLVGPVKDWQKFQPNAQINYWLDFEMVTESMIERTLERLNQLNISLLKFQFKNIRDIPIIQQSPDLFSSDINVYFRVDTSKALIGDHEFNEHQFSVVSDLDVAAISKSQMFDRYTLSKLHHAGAVLGGRKIFENSFIILSREFKNRHFDLVIDPIFSNYPVFGDGECMLNHVIHGYCYRKLVSHEGHKPYVSQIDLMIAVDQMYKAMIIPPSQHGSMGYSDEEIEKLKALRKK